MFEIHSHGLTKGPANLFTRQHCRRAMSAIEHLPSLNGFRVGGVEVTILDDERNMRHLLTSALQALGFKKISRYGSVDDLCSSLSTGQPDLLILDLDMGDEVCGLINDIRYHRLGQDPFVVIMVTTWDPQEQVIKTALNAGADDLITKPISATKLCGRISNLIRCRKKFVATPNYVGPDRRNAERQSDAPLIETPSSLRYKATGDECAVVTPDRIQCVLKGLSVRAPNSLRLRQDHR